MTRTAIKRINVTLGLCSTCGKDVPERGKRTCFKCALRMSAYNRRAYMKRKDAR